MFGENATVDLPGSLHVGTGDEVRFGDGAVYSAATPNISTLTIASPEAFGFLGNTPGAITVDRSSMELAPGKPFPSLVVKSIFPVERVPLFVLKEVKLV